MTTQISGTRQLTCPHPICPVCNINKLGRYPYHAAFVGEKKPTVMCAACYRVIQVIEFMKVRGAYRVEDPE